MQTGAENLSKSSVAFSLAIQASFDYFLCCLKSQNFRSDSTAVLKSNCSKARLDAMRDSSLREIRVIKTEIHQVAVLTNL